MFDDQFIPKIKFNPEKAFMSTIAHDFHYINKEGELTLPWFNHDALQKRNVSQKNIYTFSATSDYHDINAVDQERSDNILGSVTELVPVAAEDKEDLLVANRRKVFVKLHKKRKSRRMIIRHETYGDDIKKKHTNETDKHTVVRKKTIKIPFSSFAKIHNFRYPPISIEDNTDSVPQMEFAAEQELVSLSGHYPEMDLGNVLHKQPVVSKKTIKIPFSTFMKIHNFRYPPISTEAITDSVLQKEFAAEQGGVCQSEHSPEMEDILGIADNLQIANENVLNKQPVVSKKTIKIPFSTFIIIHNSRYSSISNSESTESVTQIEATAERELVSPTDYNPEMEGLIGIEENLEMVNGNVLHKQTVVSKKTIKIPLDTFVKIHNSRSRIGKESAISVDFPDQNLQKEEALEQEAVLQSEHNLEKEDLLELDTTEDNLEINHPNELDEHTKTRKRTIKIPLTIFERIHNSRSPIEKESATSVDFPDYNIQIEEALELEAVSHSEHNNKMKDILEPDTTKDNLETNHGNESHKHTRISKKTIKIPYTVFQKIYDIRYSSILPNANSDRDLQRETVTEQEVANQSEHKLEKEGMIELDAAVENSNGENKLNNQDYDNYEIKQSKKFNGHTMVRSRAIKIPISTFVEVDNFHHPPLLGSTKQNKFKFIESI